MTKTIPTIQKFMSTTPHSIGRDQHLSDAHKMMKEYKIRHLPVLEGGALVGMLTERDCALIESFDGGTASKLRVDDAMSTEVYSVSPDAKLDEVVREMASKRYGSAVVVQNAHVVGIFTTVDVCRSLAELLAGRLAS